MNHRASLELALIAAATLLGVGWCHQVGETAAARARAEMVEQRADSLYSVAAASESARAAVDVQAEAQLRDADERREAAEHRARAAAARRPEVVERVVMAAAPADTAAVREAVVELELVHGEEVRSLRSALAAADSVIAAQARQLAVRDRVAVDLRAALEASRVEADAWKVAARPGLLGIRIGSGTAFLAGVAVGGGLVYALGALR